MDALTQLSQDVEKRMAMRAELARDMRPHVEAVMADMAPVARDGAPVRERDAALVKGAVRAMELGWSTAGFVKGLGYDGDAGAKLRPKLARHWQVAQAVRDGHADITNAAALVAEDGLRDAAKWASVTLAEAKGRDTKVEAATDAIRAVVNGLAALIAGKESKDGDVVFNATHVKLALRKGDNTQLVGALAYTVKGAADLLNSLTAATEDEAAA